MQRQKELVSGDDDFERRNHQSKLGFFCILQRKCQSSDPECSGLFGTTFVLINQDCSFDEEVFPHVGLKGLNLFFVTPVNNICIDLYQISLGLGIKLSHPDGKKAEMPDDVILSNNIVHSVLSDVDMFLNKKPLPDSNNSYHHVAFVWTKPTTDPNRKKIWTVYKGYQYRANKHKNLQLNDKIMKKFTNDGLCQNCPRGPPLFDFLGCDRLLPSGRNFAFALVLISKPLRSGLLPSLSDAKVQALHENPPVLVIRKASLFVNKISLSGIVEDSIERMLTENCGVYTYMENFLENFKLQSGRAAL